MKTSHSFKGTLKVPGDKSISHRGIMFAALASGKSRIEGFLQSADCLATADCFRKMGVLVDVDHNGIVTVTGKGLHGLNKPTEILNAQNSGTTVRLLSGILAGQSFESCITGDDSIQKRPMKRIMEPLSQMGANITSIRQNNCAPLHIMPGVLQGIRYQSPVSSAQVKSCILLAGLYANEKTIVTEPAVSRDHTERMLSSLGANIDTNTDAKSVTIYPCENLDAFELTVPGDISSAAYFIAAALLCPNSEIRLLNVGINPTRDGFLQVVGDMGAEIAVENVRFASGEPVADLIIHSTSLEGCEIGGDIIPTLIDEIPMIAVMAAFAKGTTIIRDASELRVKESDRIKAIVSNLTAMGANVTETEDGMIIKGGAKLHPATLQAGGDHRIAMSFAIAQLAIGSSIDITDKDCVNISYPHFYEDVDSLLDR